VDAPAHDDVESPTLDAAAIGGTPVPVMAIAPGTGATDPVGAADPSGSPRVRLGRWLVGVAAAIAGSELDELVKRSDDNSPFSHAA
jgi:hypothetical protein